MTVILAELAHQVDCDLRAKDSAKNSTPGSVQGSRRQGSSSEPASVNITAELYMQR